MLCALLTIAEQCGTRAGVMAAQHRRGIAVGCIPSRHVYPKQIVGWRGRGQGPARCGCSLGRTTDKILQKTIKIRSTLRVQTRDKILQKFNKRRSYHKGTSDIQRTRGAEHLGKFCSSQNHLLDEQANPRATVGLLMTHQPERRRNFQPFQLEPKEAPNDPITTISIS